MRCLRQTVHTSQTRRLYSTVVWLFPIFPGFGDIPYIFKCLNTMENENATSLLNEHNRKTIYNALSTFVVSHIHYLHMYDVCACYSPLPVLPPCPISPSISLLPGQPSVGQPLIWAWSYSRFIPVKKEAFLASATCIKVTGSDVLQSHTDSIEKQYLPQYHYLTLIWNLWYGRYVNLKNKFTFLSGQMTLLAIFWQTHISFYSHIKAYRLPNSPYSQQFINGHQI